MNLYKRHRFQRENTGHAAPVSRPEQGRYISRTPFVPLPAGCHFSPLRVFESQKAVSALKLLETVSGWRLGLTPCAPKMEYRNYVPYSMFNKFCRSAPNCGAKALLGFTEALAAKNKNNHIFQDVMSTHDLWHAQCINTGIMQDILNNTKEEVEMEKIRRFFKEEEGVTAIEYGLIAVLVALAIITGAGLLGTNLNTLFNDTAGHLVDPN